MGILLFAVSVLLAILLAIPALVHTIIAAFRWNGGWKTIDGGFLRAAHAIDIFGNVAYPALFNDLFLRKYGYHYGKPGETLSSVTGKNLASGHLTWLGKGLAATLNLVDWKNWKNGGHCYMATGEEFRAIYGPPDWWRGALWAVPFLVIAAVGLYLLSLLVLWISRLL